MDTGFLDTLVQTYITAFQRGFAFCTAQVLPCSGSYVGI
jgi:hypothetical protein